MDPREQRRLDLTRRRFFGVAASGLSGALGAAALGALGSLVSARPSPARRFAARGVHHRPTAKRVIYMHMEGAPSQIDLFDHKPGLH